MVTLGPHEEGVNPVHASAGTRPIQEQDRTRWAEEQVVRPKVGVQERVARDRLRPLGLHFGQRAEMAEGSGVEARQRLLEQAPPPIEDLLMALFHGGQVRHRAGRELCLEVF
jgi:hypothetical protein